MENLEEDSSNSDYTEESDDEESDEDSMEVYQQGFEALE